MKTSISQSLDLAECPVEVVVNMPSFLTLSPSPLLLEVFHPSSSTLNPFKTIASGISDVFRECDEEETSVVSRRLNQIIIANSSDENDISSFFDEESGSLQVVCSIQNDFSEPSSLRISELVQVKSFCFLFFRLFPCLVVMSIC